MIIKSISYLLRGLKFYLAGRLLMPKPRVIHLWITERCNSKCIMCSFWRRTPIPDIPVEKIKEIFSNNLLNQLEFVVISGGESTLREDLADIVRIIVGSSPSVHAIYIITNGLIPDKAEKRIREVLPIIGKVRLNVVVSLDGIGKKHDDIRGVEGAFKKTSETIDRLLKLRENFNFNIIINSIVQKSNIDSIGALNNFAVNKGVRISFRPVARKTHDDGLMISADELNRLKNEISKLELDQPCSIFWPNYFKMRKAGKRILPCAIPYYVIYLAGNGDVYACGMYDQVDAVVYGNIINDRIDRIWHSSRARKMRQFLKKERCANCFGHCEIAVSLSEEVFFYAKYLIGRKINQIKNAIIDLRPYV